MTNYISGIVTGTSNKTTWNLLFLLLFLHFGYVCF
jgi:hypothetical protein